MARRGYSTLTPGVMPGSRSAPPIQDAPQTARVVSVTAAGVVFELDATKGHSYGPAPWCIGSYATPALAVAGGFYPHVGDTCLVVFAGAGIDTPWVLAWSR